MQTPLADTRRRARAGRGAIRLTVALSGCVIVCTLLIATMSLLQARRDSRLAADLAGIGATATRLATARQLVALGEGLDPAELTALGRQLDAELAAVGPAVAGLDGALGTRLQQAADTPPAVGSAGSLFTVLDDARAAAGRSAERATNAALAAVAAVAAAAVVAVVAATGHRRRRPGSDGEEGGRTIARLADARLWTLVAHDDELLLVYRADRRTFHYVSPSVEAVLGIGVADLVAGPVSERFVHPDDVERWNDTLAEVTREANGHRRMTVRALRSDGSVAHLEADITNLLDEPAVAGVVVNARDVTDRVNLELDLAHQASHDSLTGLANRAWFTQQVTAALQRVTDPAAVSIVLLDLDGFKEINDSLGHGAGDDVLVTTAARLAATSRHRDCVARLGGDEFALLLVDDDGRAVAQRLVAALAEPIELEVGPVTIGASVGVATADADSTVVSLLRDADAAMYDAKSRGRNRISLFDPAMHDALVERMQLRAELDAAIAAAEFRLVYQPKLNLDDGSVEGFEALLRWVRADGTVTPPNDFIPLAESTGQIVPIGAWVLRTALTQLAHWQAMPGCDGLTMAVNVSVRQLTSADFVATVRHALDTTGVDPATVTLEITETMLMADTDDAARVLAELRWMGVRIAVDDYGSGHASIGYLRRLPIDVLKIDRSFVAALDHQPDEAEAYLRSITDLARSLRLDTVAEGIEHEHQLAQLRRLGCTSGQGFHLARPLTTQAAADFLQRRTRRLALPDHAA